MITSERKKVAYLCFLTYRYFSYLKKMLKKYAVNDLELRTISGCYRNVR